MLQFDSVDHALADLAGGRPVIVVDDESRENEGDLIFAAEHATPDLLAFTVRHTSGYICVALPDHDADRLDLPAMVRHNEDSLRTAYTVTVDASTGVSTGISAHDRARTIRLLADASSSAADFRRPGHVLPLRARPGGVLERPGHTEAGVDLMRLAGLRPAAALCEIVSVADPTDMARLPELVEFAREHDLRIISIKDLAEYRLGRLVEQVGAALLPLDEGRFRALGYRDTTDAREHIALVMGDASQGEDVLVRVHSECLTGDVLGSLRCDCGTQLTDSLAAIGAHGRGVLVYLRGHEGRGIGLLAKLRAYQLQDGGANTVDANLGLGLPVDARDYAVAAAILKDLGVRSARLLTGNPTKVRALEAHGIPVSATVPLPARFTEHNREYLRTKVERMGHILHAEDGDLPGVSSARGVSSGQDRPSAQRVSRGQTLSRAESGTAAPLAHLRNGGRSLRDASDRGQDEGSMLTGTVEYGDARGRTLGYPTANLEFDSGTCEFPDGVYGGVARVLDGDLEGVQRVAAISIGSNPTFAGVGPRFEVHLLDFDGDLYGSTLEVLPLTFIRPTLTFESVEALIKQIDGDVQEIREIAEQAVYNRLRPAESDASSSQD